MVEISKETLTLTGYETVIVRKGEIVYRRTFTPDEKREADRDYERLKRITRRAGEEVGLVSTFE